MSKLESDLEFKELRELKIELEQFWIQSKKLIIKVPIEKLKSISKWVQGTHVDQDSLSRFRLQEFDHKKVMMLCKEWDKGSLRNS